MVQTRTTNRSTAFIGQSASIAQNARNPVSQRTGQGRGGRRPSAAQRPLEVPEVPVQAVDIVGLADQISAAAQSYPIWMNKKVDVARLEEVDRGLTPLRLSESVSSVKKSMAAENNTSTVEELIMGLRSNPILAYLTRICVMDLDKKKSIKTLKLFSTYKTFETFQSDFNGAWAIVFHTAERPDGLYRLLVQLDKSDRLSQTMRTTLQNRARTGVRMPPEMSAMISGCDKLNGAVAKYVNCDDEEISLLREKLKELTNAKQRRVEEVSGLKKRLQEFNSLRGGVLTQEETVTAYNTYATRSDLSEKFTINGFIEIIKADKQKRAISGSLRNFTDLGSNLTITEFHRKSLEVKDRARAILDSLGSGGVPPGGNGEYSDNYPEGGDEIMDHGDDDDFNDVEGF